MRRLPGLLIIICAAFMVTVAFSSTALADTGKSEPIEPVLIPEVRTIEPETAASSVHFVETRTGVITRKAKSSASYGSEESWDEPAYYEDSDYAEEEDKESPAEFPEPEEKHESEDKEDAEGEQDFSGDFPEITDQLDESDIYSHFTEEELLYFEEQEIYADSIYDLSESISHDDEVLPDESMIYDEDSVDESFGDEEYPEELTSGMIEEMENAGMRAE